MGRWFHGLTPNCKPYFFFLASFEPCGGNQAEKWWSRNCKTLHLQFIFTNQLRHINLRFPLFTIIAFLLTDFFFFQGREILMRMLEVFVRKFQSIAKHHVPAIFKRWYFILSLVLFFEEIVNYYKHVDLIRTEDQIRWDQKTELYNFTNSFNNCHNMMMIKMKDFHISLFPYPRVQGALGTLMEIWPDCIEKFIVFFRGKLNSIKDTVDLCRFLCKKNFYCAI